MTVTEFEDMIHQAYKGRHRSNLWLACALQCEASELAEHIMKFDGYRKVYDREEIRSEAGDILNFLTALLHAHNLTLNDVMIDNAEKLEDRGWV